MFSVCGVVWCGGLGAKYWTNDITGLLTAQMIFITHIIITIHYTSIKANQLLASAIEGIKWGRGVVSCKAEDREESKVRLPLWCRVLTDCRR